MASPAFSGPHRGRPASVCQRCLIATDQAGPQPAYRERGLRPRAAAIALQRALAVRPDEYLGGGRPRMAGKRIREVEEETERQLGQGTWTDSLARNPRPAWKAAMRRFVRRRKTTADGYFVIFTDLSRNSLV